MFNNANNRADDSESENSREEESLSSESLKTSSKGTDTENKSKEEDDAIKEQLAQKETRNVFLLRLLVFFVLLCAAVAVSIVVYTITSSAEEDEFKNQFAGTAKQVTDAFESIVKQKLGAISALSVAAIAHGVDHSEAWPFVTLSSFQERATTARSLSDALFIGICPQVTDANRGAWEKYVVSSANSWIAEGFQYQKSKNLDQFLLHNTTENEETRLTNTTKTSDPIFYYNEDQTVPQYDEGPGPYFPVWETSPLLRRNFINQNLFRNPSFAKEAQLSWDTHSAIIGRMISAPPGDLSSKNRDTSFYATIMSLLAGEKVYYNGDQMSNVYLPIFNSFDADRSPVAILFAVIRWATYFEHILPPNLMGVSLILENTCDISYSYVINGPVVQPVGPGDQHDCSYSSFQRTASLAGLVNIADGTELGLTLNQDECKYNIHVYPSDEFRSQYTTNTPIIITMSVAIIFVFTASMFVIYDRLVERRQRLIMRKAVQSTAIVSSLFPKNIRDRLLDDNDMPGKGNNLLAPNHRLKSYLKGDDNEKDYGLQPIADLFPHATVMFADIAGFTAWSSTRDPAQVFILLQTVYQAFDVIAKRRNVFKVETIGDSYVAVTGLPDPQEKHAVIMARFAGECLTKMDTITKDLEVSLGPDTGDLSMRIGLHSGPVTAGVLRGERSRFQLFGDTVNTAARMESTGIATRIQISQATADLLLEAGKEHWVKPRKDLVEAKGKGVMKTFWLTPHASKKGPDSNSESEPRQDAVDDAATNKATSKSIDPAIVVKQERLVNWIVELLVDHVKHILIRRSVLGTNMVANESMIFKPEPGTMSLDEVAEVISMPKFDAKIAAAVRDHHAMVVDEAVRQQLHDYVSTIAAAYRDNPFHNFEHACHVTMAVNKFLKRIVTPDVDTTADKKLKSTGDIEYRLHDYTHGIHSDPLIHFAIVLSALIHDVDHRGVSNAQLIKEDEKMARMYRNKSVAEQNSLDLSWDLLMTEQFEALRKCICATHANLRRFRQILVNVVLATDIFDKELNDLRRARWEKAFGASEKTENDNDLRATIVIEHLIQASDVSHTMQHWHIYRKWNKRLYTELYRAFEAGRMGLNPSSFWYKGELGFFDNYIIPLAKKLKDCNVFGVSSDECLNYALKNRVEWEERGQEIVAQMTEDLLAEKSELTATKLK